MRRASIFEKRVGCLSNWAKTYSTAFDGRHLKIERRDGKPVVAKWDVLQEIKNDIAGHDALAIEIFPETDRVVDEINRRHLWIVQRDELPQNVFLR